MKDGHTEIGGRERAFPLTTANFQAQLREPSPKARQAVMTTLAQRYWKPVYYFLRLTYSKGNEESKDLTQAFFLWLLERDLLLKFDPRRGAFRTYLKGLLRNFAGNEHQALQRLKRGGGIRLLPLEEDSVPVAGDPEKLFDEVWMREVVARAVGRVRTHYQSTRRVVPFLAFEQIDLVAERPTYAEVAARLGVKVGDVRTYLAEVREKVRAEAKLELAASGDPADAADDLFKA